MSLNLVVIQSRMDFPCSHDSKRMYCVQLCKIIVTDRINNIFHRNHTGVDIIGPLTLLIQQHDSALLNDSRSSSDERAYSATNVVKQIITNLIIPKVVMSQPTLNGVILLGPPGVGKSYAISAVRSLCRDICQVSLFLFNIILFFFMFF